MTERCFYFGCWNNKPGHYLRAADGHPYGGKDLLEYYDGRRHIDGTLAPRRTDDGDLCWSGQGAKLEDCQRITFRSIEYPQGQFLLHHLDNGFTAIQWWDRTQGDGRGACNSTILLEGRHTADEMLAALEQYFPSVLQNLTKAGIKLLEVTK